MAETVTVRATPTLTLLQALLLSHAVLQLLDLSSTAWALQSGGYEANPIARGMIAQGWWVFGGAKMLVALGFIGLWPILDWMRPGEVRMLTAAMGVFAVFMAMVVTNNLLIAL